MGLALLASLVLVAAPATAMYVVTPLRANASTNAAEVGDTIEVRVEAENETTAGEWAGELVLAFYAYDTSENADDPEEASSSGSYVKEVINDSLALDEEAHASFSWTVPQEADDHNVAIRIESADGELLALVDIAVGDAPAVMRALAGSEGGVEEVVPENETGEATEGDDPDASTQVPGAGVALGLGALSVSALAWRRRRA